MGRIPSNITALPFAEQLRWLRRQLGENQTCFWRRFGVTQSQGCRYEHGGEIPLPVAILLLLYVDMHVSDPQLSNARTLIGSRQPCQPSVLRVPNETAAH